MINGYLVKGIGRTRLVSSLTDLSHASGGAYLEESVREAIYSEIVRAEFPHSAVPVLAIIDTGLFETWNIAEGVKIERRILLVRPCFVRPAHFVRATGFISDDPREGSYDSLRVGATFDILKEALGYDALKTRYETFWVSWAQQLAYAFAHRLPHGSDTISNISFDGKLLDFGAISAVPSWADAATMSQRQSFKALSQLLLNLISATGIFFGRYVDPSYSTENGISKIAEAVDFAFRRTLVCETLRLCGVERGDAEEVADGSDFELLWEAVLQVVRYFQAERIDMVECTPPVRRLWDLEAVWDRDAPPHLRQLNTALLNLVPVGRHHEARERSSLLLATRENLFREEAKRCIFTAVDPSAGGGEPNRLEIEQFICQQLARGRRDHRMLVDGGIPVGFAVGNDASYVIFKENNGLGLFAQEEFNGGSLPISVGRRAIQSITANTITFEGGTEPFFEGAIQLWPI